jgi:hypothetical protein
VHDAQRASAAAMRRLCSAAAHAAARGAHGARHASGAAPLAAVYRAHGAPVDVLTRACTRACILARRTQHTHAKTVCWAFCDAVEAVTLPEALGAEEALVRMLAAPVNPADLNQIEARACVAVQACILRACARLRAVRALRALCAVRARAAAARYGVGAAR